MKRKFNKAGIASSISALILSINPSPTSSATDDEGSGASNNELSNLEVEKNVGSLPNGPLTPVTDAAPESNALLLEKSVKDSSDPKEGTINLEVEKKRKLLSDCSSTPKNTDLSISSCPEKYHSIPFTSELNLLKRFPSNNLKKIMVNEDYKIHSIATVYSLLEEKAMNGEKTDLRFLVDTTGKAWFARETHSDFPAPAHYQMTGLPQNMAYCRTAGNLFFSGDYKTLNKLNNKSGDFRPSFDSLKWFIAILILNENSLPFALPETLLMDEFSSSGRLEHTWKLNIPKFRQWVQDAFTSKGIIEELQIQTQETKTVSYTKEQDSTSQFITSSYSFFNFDCSGKADVADMPRINLF